MPIATPPLALPERLVRGLLGLLGLLFRFGLLRLLFLYLPFVDFLLRPDEPDLEPREELLRDLREFREDPLLERDELFFLDGDDVLAPAPCLYAQYLSLYFPAL